MFTTPTTLGKAANPLLTRPPQADRKVRPKENATKPTTQASVPTPNADYDTHKKERVWLSKEPPKAKAKESRMAKANMEEKHLDHHQETHIEVPHLQATAEPLPAENG